MSAPEFVGFFNSRGSLTWNLPPAALESLNQATPEVREQIFRVFSNNIDVFCTALLASFGNKAKVETMNLIMHDLKELADKP